MESLVTAAESWLAQVRGAPAFLVGAIIRDLEHAALVEVKTAAIALQPLEWKIFKYLCRVPFCSQYAYLLEHAKEHFSTEVTEGGRLVGVNGQLVGSDSGILIP